MVRDLVIICRLIGSSEFLGLFVSGIGCERCEEHYALCHIAVLAELTDNSVKSVTSEELDIKSLCICFLQNHRSSFVVDRKEHKICAGGLYSLNLRWKIRVSVCEGLFRNDFKVYIGNALKAGEQSRGVNCRRIVNNSNLLRKLLFTDILRGGRALVGIREANAECIFRLDAFNCGTGRREQEHVILFSFNRNRLTWCTGYRSDKQFCTVVLDSVVCFKRKVCSVCVILVIKLKLHTVYAACRVDLFDRQFRAVFDCGSIGCGSSGDRSDSADFKNAFAVLIAAWTKHRGTCKYSCSSNYTGKHPFEFAIHGFSLFPTGRLFAGLLFI